LILSLIARRLIVWRQSKQVGKLSEFSGR
jgi:hypothetical protein